MKKEQEAKSSMSSALWMNRDLYSFVSIYIRFWCILIESSSTCIFFCGALTKFEVELATFLWPCVVFQHIVTCHGNTLLPQFLGMYRVTVENEDTYLLVMRNVFSHRLHVHRKYDLKVNPVWIKQEWLWGVGRTECSLQLYCSLTKAKLEKIVTLWR